jgi:hypothetical protein
MSIDVMGNKAEEILNTITVGLHHPQFREAIITCMKEFGEWRIEQFKAEQKQSAGVDFLPVLIENYNATKDGLAEEDKGRPAIDLINELYEDLIIIYKHKQKQSAGGWVKVNSESDLPTKDCRYWIANENGVFDFFANKNQIKRKFQNKTLTHYKELEESLPPLNLSPATPATPLEI